MERQSVMAATMAEHLTPFDTIMPNIYIRLCFLFNTRDGHANVAALQLALRSLAKQVPWLKGRICSNDEGGASKTFHEIRYHHDEEVRLLTDVGPIAVTYGDLATRDKSLKSLPAHVWPISSDNMATAHADGARVIGASIFRCKDDHGAGICVSAHHKATDAYGLAEIVRLWTEHISNANVATHVHAGRAKQLSAALSTQLEEVSSDTINTLLHDHPEYSLDPRSIPSPFPVCTSKHFTISLDRLNEFKRQVQQQTATVMSTNTILSALLWIILLRIRSARDSTILTNNETSRLGMAVNGRKRIASQFSTATDPYLGNVILCSLATCAVQDVLHASSADIAIDKFAKICTEIARSNSVSTIDAHHAAEVYSLVNKLSEREKSLSMGFNPFDTRDIMVSSWADLDFYEMNFGPGLGTPEFVRLPLMPADGVCCMLPRRRRTLGKGTMVNGARLDSCEIVEVGIMLRKDDMEILEGDALWNSLLSQA